MTKTATAAVPNELYDELSLEERDAFDRIAARGWKPETAGRGWAATRGDERLGPCPDLEQLDRFVAELDEEAESAADSTDDPDPIDGSGELEPSDLDDSSQVELEADYKGNVYLPKMGPIVDEQLAAAAGKYHAANTDWKDAGKLRKQAKDELVTVAHMKPELFTPDPDNSNAKIYRAGGIIIRISNETKEVVETEIEEEA